MPTIGRALPAANDPSQSAPDQRQLVSDARPGGFARERCRSRSPAAAGILEKTTLIDSRGRAATTRCVSNSGFDPDDLDSVAPLGARRPARTRPPAAAIVCELRDRFSAAPPARSTSGNGPGGSCVHPCSPATWTCTWPVKCGRSVLSIIIRYIPSCSEIRNTRRALREHHRADRQPGPARLSPEVSPGETERDVHRLFAWDCAGSRA